MMHKKSPHGSYSDDELVKLILEGDGDAYTEVITRYKNMIYSAIFQILSGDPEAEDIAQETFIDGYFRLSTLKNPAQLAPWLYGMARRKALHYCTRKRQHADIDVLADFLAADPDAMPHTYPEEYLIRRETRAAVREAISRLSEKNRTVTEMFYLKNITIQDIASRLSLSVGTVKSRLYEAREKLKGELAHMSEINKRNIEEKTPSADFTAEVEKKIEQMKYYFALNGGTSHGIEDLISEVNTLSISLPEATKDFFISEANLIEFYHNNNQESFKKAFDAARKGKNPDVITECWINIILNEYKNREKVISIIDNEALPELTETNYDNGKGKLFFWRGSANIYLDRFSEAKEDFEKAVNLCNKDDVYRACAICALKVMNICLIHSAIHNSDFQATAETIIQKDGKVFLVNQPGFTTDGVFYNRHQYSCLHYYAAAGRMFFDLSVKETETITDRYGSRLVCLGYNDTVNTPAGVFENCMHIQRSDTEYSADVWYCKNVGLIKAVFTPRSGDPEEYLLDEYTINGGDGYFPFAENNRWHYVNPNLPDYLYQNFDYEIIWTDGERATLSTLYYVNLRKDYKENYKLDSAYYISKCDRLCEEWKLDEAIEELKLAVRANTTQKDTYTALNGIEVLKRFSEYHKKGWRFCPSGIASSSLDVKDGTVIYGDGNIHRFGPYCYGTRFKENRIFGVKPFRYLQQLLFRIYDEKWIPGYTEESSIEGAAISFTVSEGGTVKTRSGIYENTIKLTLKAEKQGLGADYYFKDNYHDVFCGTKEFWLAKGVGIVKFDFNWGSVLNASSELVSYNTPAADDSYMPIQIGNRWEYDEVNLTNEGYRAKRMINVVCGMNDKYMITDNQEFIYQGTEEEYKAFKASLKKKV